MLTFLKICKILFTLYIFFITLTTAVATTMTIHTHYIYNILYTHVSTYISCSAHLTICTYAFSTRRANLCRIDILAYSHEVGAYCCTYIYIYTQYVCLCVLLPCQCTLNYLNFIEGANLYLLMNVDSFDNNNAITQNMIGESCLRCLLTWRMGIFHSALSVCVWAFNESGLAGFYFCSSCVDESVWVILN